MNLNEISISQLVTQVSIHSTYRYEYVVIPCGLPIQGFWLSTHRVVYMTGANTKSRVL